jgi:hypothetical protein
MSTPAPVRVSAPALKGRGGRRVKALTGGFSEGVQQVVASKSRFLLLYMQPIAAHDFDRKLYLFRHSSAKCLYYRDK